MGWYKPRKRVLRNPVLSYCESCQRSFGKDGDKIKVCPVCKAKLKQVKFKSGLEGDRAMLLSEKNIRWAYEADVLNWQPPMCKYKPDFTIYKDDGKSIIRYEELKGWLKPEDITKMIAVKRQHEDKDIHMVFQRPSNVLRRKVDGSATTYRDWAERYGFPCYSSTVLG